MADESIDPLDVDVDAFLHSLRNGSVPETFGILGPSAEPDTWDKTGVVRLDVAISALHVMTARLAFKRFGSIFQEAIKKAVGKGEQIGRDTLIRRILSLLNVGRRLIGWVTDLVAYFLTRGPAIELEKKIRTTCLDAQREGLTLRLKSDSARGSRMPVVSRHPSPKQRKANHGGR